MQNVWKKRTQKNIEEDILHLLVNLSVWEICVNIYSPVCIEQEKKDPLRFLNIDNERTYRRNDQG